MNGHRYVCTCCYDETVDPRRWEAGYSTCLPCGELQAQRERKSWTVVQPYGKGGYQFVTSQAAREVLRNTNQKQPRN
jgi:hypothetical protein